MAPLRQTLGAALSVANAAAAAKYDQYILAPSSRSLHPASVYEVNGTVSGADSLTTSSNSSDGRGSAIFKGPSAVAYDFGKNIAGLVTLQVGDVDEDQYIGLTYTESSLWISSEGCDATADAGLEEALWFHVTGPGNYTVERQHERGAFRYLSLIHNTTGGIEVQQVNVHFTPMPHYADDQLRDYTGYFHCDDELLNRVWYAGAYTNQICTIDPNHGDALVHLGEINSTQPGSTGPNTWYNNMTITNGTAALTDGAKRDRLVWAGDMAIAVPALVVSTNDLISVTNSLDSLFGLQNATTGQLPYAGVGFRQTFSATYHLYTLIGVADHYLYSGDMEYLQGKWDDWKFAMNYSLSTIDDSGLMNVTSSNDWLRFGMGGHNIEANAILYNTINQGLSLAEALNDTSVIDSWTEAAAGIKSAANNLLWNETAGLYHDNETTTLMPQDGNCWAVVANLTDSNEKNMAISQGLSTRWGPYGAPAVEAKDAVSPFISGFELEAHLEAGNVTAALALMRLQWGYMLDYKYMTNSTFIEGYSFDGSLHYAPYTNDPRISHAHGWATGPTSTLTFYIGGIHLLSAAGETWEISPRLGDLKEVDTGFETPLGTFASQVNASSDGAITGMRFQTPPGTMGSVSVPGVSGTLVNANGTTVQLQNGMAENVMGGIWMLMSNATGTVGGGGNGTMGSATPTPYTGAAPRHGASARALAVCMGLFAYLL
ncbi:bacterial alpha-L-rhamnosidase domain-containing protein [Hortaea werneckii]|nr:bacterial alpha-L-rhamnosidase domain-containing protein [Hortaea werneckii]